MKDLVIQMEIYAEIVEIDRRLWKNGVIRETS